MGCCFLSKFVWIFRRYSTDLWFLWHLALICWKKNVRGLLSEQWESLRKRWQIWEVKWSQFDKSKKEMLYTFSLRIFSTFFYSHIYVINVKDTVFQRRSIHKTDCWSCGELLKLRVTRTTHRSYLTESERFRYVSIFPQSLCHRLLSRL